VKIQFLCIPHYPGRSPTTSTEMSHSLQWNTCSCRGWIILVEGRLYGNGGSGA